MANNDMDVASVIAPSEMQFEFDDLVVNSQAYRRVFAQARARFGTSGDRGPSEQQATVGLVDVSVSAMARPGESSTTQLTPAVIEELRGLSLEASADYSDNLNFTATLAAGLESAGFGAPNIYIYRRTYILSVTRHPSIAPGESCRNKQNEGKKVGFNFSSTHVFLCSKE